MGAFACDSGVWIAKAGVLPCSRRAALRPLPMFALRSLRRNLVCLECEAFGDPRQKS